jgi:hypothetical protein
LRPEKADDPGRTGTGNRLFPEAAEPLLPWHPIQGEHEATVLLRRFLSLFGRKLDALALAEQLSGGIIESPSSRFASRSTLVAMTSRLLS